MTDQSSKYIPQFFVTAPTDCPYLPGQRERKIFTTLSSPMNETIHNELVRDGFRRSQNILYKPACEECHRCISARVVVDGFHERRSFKRILKANPDVVSQVLPPVGTNEQYGILRGYLDDRHFDGGMTDMSVYDYRSMVEDTAVATQVIEYRLTNGIDEPPGQLIATALTDVLDDGLSMVYSFFDPDFRSRSLGTYMILDHIRLTQKLGRPYLYLGYWIDECQKMSYKANFQPLEILQSSRWRRWEDRE